MQEMNTGNSEFENALKSLIPINAGIDPIAVAFAAGRKCAKRQVHLWQSAAVLLLALSGASWMLPIHHPAAPILHESMPAVAVAQPMPQFSRQSLLLLNEAALEKGVDAMPLESFPSVKFVHASDVY